VVGDAVTILAPFIAMPPDSIYSPHVTGGDVLRKDERDIAMAGESMKWVAFSEDSEKRMPLFARIATG